MQREHLYGLSAGSVTPELFEPRWRQLSVTHRVLNILVPCTIVSIAYRAAR
jgi:hypothetical protein